MGTPSPPLNLDELEALERDATAGPWEPCHANKEACQCALVWSPKDDAVVLTTAVYDASDVRYTQTQNTKNQRFVVAVRNAFSALAIELRTLRAENERLRNEQT